MMGNEPATAGHEKVSASPFTALRGIAFRGYHSLSPKASADHADHDAARLVHRGSWAQIGVIRVRARTRLCQ